MNATRGLRAANSPPAPRSGRGSSRDGPKDAPKVQIWAVGGGKGGVGKSIIATDLAVELAQSGQRVVLVDGDLGGANLDTLLGCQRPRRSLADFFSRRVSQLADVAVETGIERLALICGDSETLGAANPAHSQKLKLIRHLRSLSCDFVVLDLGAGTTFNTLDLYLAADLGIAVTLAEPTAIQNCFTFLKAVALRELERRTGLKQRDTTSGSIRQRLRAAGDAERSDVARETQLVINRARPHEGRKVLEMINGLVSRFLGGNVRLAGTVRDDPAVGRSVQRMQPIATFAPESDAARDLQSLCQQLRRQGEAGPAAPRVRMGLNEEVEHNGMRLHVQTEDLGEAQGAVRTQIFFSDGSVAYSRRTSYADSFFVRLSVAEGDRVKIHHAAIRRGLEQGRIPLAGRRSA
ncbi:MAG: MinD/ParA family protein [Myxococcales bacterium FL481]|nr:MAG: MinD/ParA family protein [Myxococcales bacterium FL481]